MTVEHGACIDCGASMELDGCAEEPELEDFVCDPCRVAELDAANVGLREQKQALLERIERLEAFARNVAGPCTWCCDESEIEKRCAQCQANALVATQRQGTEGDRR